MNLFSQTLSIFKLENKNSSKLYLGEISRIRRHGQTDQIAADAS